jgi:putative flippase GtrA
VTIIGNFLLLEYLVFADMRSESGQMWVRFLKSFAFNNVEAVVRIPIIPCSCRARTSRACWAAITLAAAFVVRFVYHALWVYAPKRKATSRVATRPSPARPSVRWNHDLREHPDHDVRRRLVPRLRPHQEAARRAGCPYTYVDLVADPAAADVAREISGRTNIPVVVYPDASHHVEPTNADVEAKLRELS